MTELHCLTFIHKDQELIYLALNWFLLQQVKDRSCIYAEVWFTKDPSLLSHGRLWMRRWRMDAGHEDWRHKGTCLTRHPMFVIGILIFLFPFSVNFSLRFSLLERQKPIQHCRRKDWVWFTRDQVANLLEHTLLQDLPRYEDRPQDKIHYHPQARHFAVLADCWRPIPRHLTGSNLVEVANWSTGLLTDQL